MAFKIGADIDLSVLVESLNSVEKKLDEQNKRLREYLHRPHGNIRQLFGVVPTSSTKPLVIDLGAPGGGQLWSVQQVVIGEDDPLTGTLASTAAAIFIGSIPSVVTFNTDISACCAANLPIPSNYQAGGKSLICRANQHLYVMLSGSGIPSSGHSFFATATVLEVPDTTEALLWI